MRALSSLMHQSSFWTIMHGLQGQGPCHFENILQVENILQLIVVTKLGQCPKLRSVYLAQFHSSIEGVRFEPISNKNSWHSNHGSPLDSPCLLRHIACCSRSRGRRYCRPCIHIQTFPSSPIASRVPRPQPRRLSPRRQKNRQLLAYQTQAERDMEAELEREKRRLATQV